MFYRCTGGRISRFEHSMFLWKNPTQRKSDQHTHRKDCVCSPTPSWILWNIFSVVISAIQEMWPAVHVSQETKAQMGRVWRMKMTRCGLCLCQHWHAMQRYLAYLDHILGPGISFGLRYPCIFAYLCYSGVFNIALIPIRSIPGWVQV